MTLPSLLVAVPAALVGYAYAGYPLALWVAGRGRPPRPLPAEPDVWPLVSISLPAYNEEAQIRGALESLLALDYPAGRLQVVVVSDASTDGTDGVVREFAGRGVELIRLPRRSGKTAAENAAAPHLRGEIVVNTDASIRIRRDALKPMVRAFLDPSVGVASGRDVSVGALGNDANAGESGYVGYEMGVRSLETRVAGIVGSSGCFYAIRPHLHRMPLPEKLSRDFASALTAREHGFRAVSVDEAVCLVPRTASLRREYRRKVRTMTRGMETLLHKRALLHPFRYGAFAWMLFSHKVCRWLAPWALLGVPAALAMLSADHLWARWMLAALGGVVALAAPGWAWPEGRTVPRLFALPAAVVAGNVAAIHSTLNMLAGNDNPTWEPTRREVVLSGE